MRAIVASLVLAAVSTTLVTGCVPDKRKQPEWQKAPKSWDPAKAEMTFGKEGLDAFNTLSRSKRDAWIEEMKGKPGSFTGQAVFKVGAELGEKMDDFEYGAHEIYAVVPEPVLYEIEMEYKLYTAEDKSTGIPPGAFLEFKGTIAEVDYQADSKPRKLFAKIKADEVKVLQQKLGE